ncbi:AhpC/TSA family protein [Chitinophaga horti]|uniref:AhpC/TSA family protein n=1 Tax=Chitinophaga horti TaxID=2920382 RepID=A0ABY6IX09_9BACT|nr:TlpA disulfide reductase family protein [Chitinophaga horti]UYQ91726.1 AhpC/TSA family protein [Chitinophaga horti]
MPTSKFTSLLRLLFLSYAILFIVPAEAQYKFQISGKLNNGAGRTLYLSPTPTLPNHEKELLDSVKVDGRDSFFLAGEISFAGRYALFLSTQRAYIGFYLDTTPVYIKADTNRIYQAAIRGSAEHDLISHFDGLRWSTQSALEADFNKLMQLGRQTPMDTPQVSHYRRRVDSLSKRVRHITDSFMMVYPQSFVTLELLIPNDRDTAAFATAERYIKNMPEKYVRNPSYRRVVKLLAAYNSVRIGAVVPEVTQADTTRKQMISSKQLLNYHDYLLLDFWASWCGPCRANNPELKQLYAKYKGPRFEIAGVSLDNNLQLWKKALLEEGTTWPNMSDLQGFSNKSALEFNIQAIPAYLLLDKQGRLVFRTNKMTELKAKLEELL